jgi:hypothetical protein
MNWNGLGRKLISDIRTEEKHHLRQINWYLDHDLNTVPLEYKLGMMPQPQPFQFPCFYFNKLNEKRALRKPRYLHLQASGLQENSLNLFH